MAAGTVSAADVGAERDGAEVAGRNFRARRALARGPQDVRYATVKFYGLDGPAMSAEAIQQAMRITPEEFEELRRRGIKSLREAERG